MLYKYKHFIFGVLGIIIGIIFILVLPINKGKDFNVMVTDMYSIKNKIYFITNIPKSSAENYNFAVMIEGDNPIEGEVVSDEEKYTSYLIDTKDSIEDDFKINLVKSGDINEYIFKDKAFFEFGKYRFEYINSTNTFKRKDTKHSLPYNTFKSLKGLAVSTEVMLNEYNVVEGKIQLSITAESGSYQNQYVQFNSNKKRIGYKILKVYNDKEFTKIVYELEPGLNEQTIKAYIKVGVGASDVAKQKTLVVTMSPTEIEE